MITEEVLFQDLLKVGLRSTSSKNSIYKAALSYWQGTKIDEVEI